MNPMERWAAAARVIGIVIQIQNVVNCLGVHNGELDRSTETYLNAYLITIAQYGRKTLEILNSDGVQPLLGKRCLFY